MIRCLALRRGALAVMSTALLLAGCAKAPTPAEWHLSHDGEFMYNFLVQVEAAVSGDETAFSRSGERLLELEPDEGAFLEMADFALRRSNFEEARITARKGLASFPASLPLTLIISDSYLQQEKFREAAEILHEFCRNNPGNREAEQELARAFLMGERYEEFDELLKEIPSSRMTPYLHYVKARSLINRNRIEEGEKELRLVVRESPEMLDAWVNLGIVLQRQGKHGAAVPMFRRAVDQEPDNVILWLRLLDAQIRAGRGQVALKTLDEAPFSTSLRVEAAMIFIDTKQYTTARKILLQVRDMADSPEEVHIYLAAIAMDNLNAPAEALRELAAIPPRSPLAERALRWRLQILESLGRTGEAVSVAGTFAEENPDKPEFQVIHAMAAALAGNRAASVSILRGAHHKWPDNTMVAFYLAANLDEEKERDEALRLMEFVISREPRNASALNFVGYSLTEANRDLERARELILRAAEEEPEDPHIADSLAWVLYRLGNYQDAWEAIRKSVALGGDHPVIWEHYGDIARKLGYGKEAKKGYTNALKPKPLNADALRLKLQELQ